MYTILVPWTDVDGPCLDASFHPSMQTGAQVAQEAEHGRHAPQSLSSSIAALLGLGISEQDEVRVPLSQLKYLSLRLRPLFGYLFELGPLDREHLRSPNEDAVISCIWTWISLIPEMHGDAKPFADEKTNVHRSSNK